MSEYIIDMANSSYKSNSGLLCANVSQLREEIVRCRNCVHYKPYRTHQHGMMNRCHDEHGHTHRRDESDFCSRGERRSE